MTVTIKDVARAAKVAPSTVSRVIANSPKISEETKIRVQKTMKELGYHPNIIARSLASKSTQTIGLVFPSSGNITFQNPFFSEVLRWISESVHDKHYSLHLTTGTTEEEIYNDVVKMVSGRLVDGIILLYSKFNDKVIEYLKERKFPFVLIGKPFKYTEQITSIDNDNITAAKEGTDYLISLGHDRIGFIGGNKKLMVTKDRLIGYKRALEEANVPIREEYIIHQDFLLTGGQEAVAELLALPSPPTALLVVDDLMSLGVVRTINEMKLRVSEDISIVSFNNALFSELASPPLTSIDINIKGLATEAVHNLIVMLENKKEPKKRIIIQHEIIVRSSCKSPK